MKNYDAEIVESALINFLSDQSNAKFHGLWTALFPYSIVRSKSFLRRHRSWLSENSGEFAAEDLADYFMDRLVAYFRSSPSFVPKDWLGNPLGFLGTFHRSRAIDFLRKAHRRARQEVQYDHVPGGWDRLPLDGETPEGAIHKAMTTTAFQMAQRCLSGSQSIVVQAHLDGLMKPAQIAAQLGLSVQKVYETLRQAKGNLRESHELRELFIA